MICHLALANGETAKHNDETKFSNSSKLIPLFKNYDLLNNTGSNTAICWIIKNDLYLFTKTNLKIDIQKNRAIGHQGKASKSEAIFFKVKEAHKYYRYIIILLTIFSLHC